MGSETEGGSDAREEGEREGVTHLEVERGEVDVGPERVWVKGLDVDDVAALAETDPLADEAGGADGTPRDGRVEHGRVEELALDGDVGDALPVVVVEDDAVGEGVRGRGGLDDGEAAAPTTTAGRGRGRRAGALRLGLLVRGGRDGCVGLVGRALVAWRDG